MKNYPRRYVNENAVKKALKIDSFRNLSKEKVMQFASMIPYMDREVAMKVIDQFPVYADFGKAAIEQYTKTCDNTLDLFSQEINRFLQHWVSSGKDIVRRRFYVDIRLDTAS